MLSCAVVLFRRLPWDRLGLLVAASLVMGVGITLLVRARLGLVPMDVAHIGVARRFGWTLGGGIIATQSFLLITMTFLRIPVGIGTVLAFAVPAVTADVLLSVLPDITTLAWRIVALTTGGVACCVGVATYVLADLGRMHATESCWRWPSARRAARRAERRRHGEPHARASAST